MTAANVCDIMRARCATSSKHAACVAVRRQAKCEISWREYVQGVNEPYAFYNHGRKLTVLSYCDDIMCRGRQSDADWFYTQLSARFDIKSPTYLSKDNMLDYLGMVDRRRGRCVCGESLWCKGHTSSTKSSGTGCVGARKQPGVISLETQAGLQSIQESRSCRYWRTWIGLGRRA